MPFKETNRRKGQTGMMVDILDRHDPRQYGLTARDGFPLSEIDGSPTNTGV
jgi:hypothetical protein